MYWSLILVSPPQLEYPVQQGSLELELGLIADMIHILG
jgi:hypothetical protein